MLTMYCIGQDCDIYWRLTEPPERGAEAPDWLYVTNGDGWRFYKLTTEGEVYETLLYGIAHLEEILGLLRYIFQRCEQSSSS